jgi:hypothetical protein
MRDLGVLTICLFLVVTSMLDGTSRLHVENDSGEGTLTYARYGRRGEPSPLLLSLALREGPEELVVWVSTDYLESVDFNSWYPEPDSTRAGPKGIGLVYPHPPASLQISLDAKFSASAPSGPLGLAVWVEPGSGSMAFEATTWMLP